jgi:hypothetical protein
MREPVSRLLSHWLFLRTTPEAFVNRLGAWADYVRHAWGPLKQLLSTDRFACHFDNIGARMLLWPHPLVPDHDFIDFRHDNLLVERGIARLQQFDFADIVENPNMHSNLESWLDRPVPYLLINETGRCPPRLQGSLHNELTTEVFELLEQRTRLDLRLWTLLAKQRIAGLDVATLRQRVLLRSMARHALLMAPLLEADQ